IHSIAEHIALPLHDIAQMEADTDVHLLGYLFAGVVGAKLRLDKLDALYSVYDRGELDQKSVADSLNHAAMVFNHGLPHDPVMDCQQPQRAGFVGPHLAAKADDVGEHDRG